MEKRLTQKDVDKMLIGASASPTHIAGIRRADAVTDLYSPDPMTWQLKNGVRVPQLNWGGLSLPFEAANLHFMIAGIPGTGKTVSIRMLLQSIFDSSLRINIGGSDRAVIYDPKQEFYPILKGLGVPENDIFILNPFDRRSWCWDLAADYTDMAGALQLAETIVPCGDNLSQPFFAKAAASIFSAVVMEHMRINPNGWDLFDVICDCLTEDRILNRLERVSLSGITARNSLAKGDTRAGVLAELSTALTNYIPLAYCWRKAREKRRSFSITQFLHQNGKIAILGANSAHSSSLKPMNRMFLRRFSELTLDHTSDSRWQAKDRTWLVLDEVRELGKVHDLGTFIAKGRSKGVCAVIGLQDFPGLKDVFGDNAAQEIVNCCKHRLFLKLQGESADWASNCIGKTEVIDVSVSVQTSSSMSFGFNAGMSDSETRNLFGFRGRSVETPFHSVSSSKQSGFQISATNAINVTTSKQAKVKDAVLASEIAGLPDFQEGDGLTGFVCRKTGFENTSVVQKVHYPGNLIECFKKSSCDVGFESWGSDVISLMPEL
jgi:hypothetical protein